MFEFTNKIYIKNNNTEKLYKNVKKIRKETKVGNYIFYS